ncbi:flagellar biosynthesis protein FlhB [Exilibacterium tricleocarpae]|uniref:Flagellar biosynthetic protein FlhB n=1 Tax=Exilibacterium tricleocarpae TaxID=2591008 RepID=A0A545T850_9GAMM|nr:flagellar biosynthesis protein FlhB [Exilibacterium tricleocarpae]TQV73399.1 flagellar biosynthesis protein FlhB [Exilibacterium tricleocarpae]
MAAGSEQEQDRTEPATPFKLREARKRGQVAKSLEINSLLLLSVALVVTYFMGEAMVERMLALYRELFANAHRIDFDIPTAIGLFDYSFSALVSVLWPLVMALMLTAILANLFQTGPIFSFFPIKPDFNRLNPVSGFKRLFSKKLLFESVKTLIKIATFGAVMYFSFQLLVPKLMVLLDVDPAAYTPLLMDHGRSLAYKLLGVILLIALIDLMYSRWDFGQQMRMSRRELKEEVKRREGDPQIRARRRQLQKEAVKRAGAVRRVPDADVLITNPTHLAVALQYNSETMPAPRITAMGGGDLAAEMRRLAVRHGVPVVENKPLARALFREGEVDAWIPEALFPALAKILAWVFLQRQAADVAGSGRARG